LAATALEWYLGFHDCSLRSIPRDALLVTLPRNGSDTLPEATEIQAEVLRRLSPIARLELAVEMSMTARALLRSRLPVAHPNWTEHTVDRELLRHTLPVATLPPGRSRQVSM